jgi:RimJ/RimL family protein N-acetyltransferase
MLLDTDRLRLRYFTAVDVDRLVDLDSDPEVMRYITFGAPTPRPKAAGRCCGTASPPSASNAFPPARSRRTSLHNA